MKKIFLLNVVLIFVFTYHVNAQWTTDTLLNTKVADQSAISEVTPLQVTTPSGKTYISYFESSGSGYLMKMQLLDTSGNKLWGATGLLISNQPQSSATYRYDLKMDHENNAIVAFQDMRTGNMATVAYKVDTAGNFLWGANGIVLHDLNSTFEVAPSIGVLPTNEVVIAWNASSGSTKKIPYQKITAGGTLVWAQPLILTGANKYSRPAVLGLSTQGFMIVFVEETGSGLGVSMIKAQTFDVNGAALLPSWTAVFNTATGFASIPKVVSDNNDGCYVAILTGTPGAPAINDAFVQHVYANGAIAWGAGGIEASSLAGNHKEPVAITFRNADNHLYVLMKVLDNAQGQAGIYAQALDTSGVKQMTVNGAMLRPLSSTDYREPSGWADAGNGFITVYSEGTFGNEKLKAVKMDYNGSLLWNGNPVTLSAVASNKLNISVGDCVNGQVVSVFGDQRIDDGVYAQNINTNGSIGIITSLIENNISANNFSVQLINDHLKISTTVQSPYHLQLFSSVGELIINQKLIGEADIDITLAKEIYLYEIMSDGKRVVGKLFKR